jgi:D-arabinose 1-dehydrogenase-like Zn-dependent alcohol dehydrogenase
VRLAFSTKRLTIYLMAKMRAVQVSQAKGPLEIVEREIPKPEPGWVRLKVEACGVCHSDSLTKEGAWPGFNTHGCRVTK